MTVDKSKMRTTEAGAKEIWFRCPRCGCECVIQSDGLLEHAFGDVVPCPNCSFTLEYLLPRL